MIVSDQRSDRRGRSIRGPGGLLLELGDPDLRVPREGRHLVGQTPDLLVAGLQLRLKPGDVSVGRASSSGGPQTGAVGSGALAPLRRLVRRGLGLRHRGERGDGRKPRHAPRPAHDHVAGAPRQEAGQSEDEEDDRRDLRFAGRIAPPAAAGRVDRRERLVDLGHDHAAVALANPFERGEGRFRAERGGVARARHRDGSSAARRHPRDTRHGCLRVRDGVGLIG